MDYNMELPYYSTTIVHTCHNDLYYCDDKVQAMSRYYSNDLSKNKNMW